MKVLRVLERIPKVSNSIGTLFLVPLMLLTTADVILRYFFNAPIRGTLEFSEFMLVFIVWLGLAYTMKVKGHVGIELLVSRFSPRRQTQFDVLTCVLGLVIMVIIAWITLRMTIVSREIGELGDISKFPFWPFKAFIFIGAVVFSLELLRELILNVVNLRHKPVEEGKEA